MPNYHGCKRETINLVPHYLIGIIYKTGKMSRLEKLQIKQNINNLMLQVIFIFSDWILIKQIIIFSTPFCLGETDFQKIQSGVLSGELDMSKNAFWRNGLGAFSRNVNTINLKLFPTHSGIYKLERNNKHSEEIWNPKEFKEIWKDVSLKLILKDNGGKQYCLPFCRF